MTTVDSQAQPDTYPVEVRTESGTRRQRPTSVLFRKLLSSLGYSGEQWLIAEPIPAEPEVFFQVLRESDACYRTEIRDGDASRHLAMLAHSAEEVDRIMAAWARGDESWRTAHAWTHFESFDSDIEPDAETRAEAAAMARDLIAGGYRIRYDVARALVDAFSEVGGHFRLVHNQAMRIALPAWEARLAEQATWPERTDPDLLDEAFAALEEQGIVARADFTCCGNCGRTEIADEVGPESVGYVFFHQQSTAAVVAQGRLWLQYGACEPQPGQDTAAGTVIGQRIVDALIAAGLPVEWNGDGASAIVVGRLDWRKRLTASGSE